MNTSNMLRVLNFIKRNFSSPASTNIVGRNYLTPKDFTIYETKSLLWTAFDLKHMFKQCQEVKKIKTSVITLLLHKPCMEIQASAMSAASFLKCHLNVITDPKWDTQEFINDNGSFLSTCSDMIFCQSQYQTKMSKFAKDATIPIVCVRSCTYTALNVLADLMTLQEKYGGLKNLSLGWVGRPCPLLNAYLCIVPQFGINLQFFCTCQYSGKGMSPAVLPLGKELSEKNHTRLMECDKIESAIKRVHVIILAKHNLEEFKLKLKCIREQAEKNWSLLHQMPRSHAELGSDVFHHKNSLVWEAKGNLQYIYAAFMVRLLHEYRHLTKQPDFDNSVSIARRA